MRLRAKALVFLAVAVAAGGFAVAWSGIVNVGASTGHWKITDWFLHFAMRQSVETWSMSIAPPPLNDPALVRRGAGHYATACVSCHGAPGVARSAVTTGMTPPPPYLPEKVAEWDPEELFWIVRHGVKFTGMPAWPALQRKDEVWAVVAFLRRLPRLDEVGYRRLASGGTEPAGEAATAALDRCMHCHGRDGKGSGAFPRLAGQNEEYLYASLEAYARRTRFSGMMQAAVFGLDEQTMRGLARHYAAADPSGPERRSAGKAAEIADGERLARHGDPTRGVPACAACHGLAEGPRYRAYPSLAGQQAWYLALQLRLLKQEQRGGTAYAHIMRAVAGRMTDPQIDAVAAYYATLRAGHVHGQPLRRPPSNHERRGNNR